MPKYLQIKHLWNVLFLLISAASIQIKYNPGYLCSSTLLMPTCRQSFISWNEATFTFAKCVRACLLSLGNCSSKQHERMKSYITGNQT